MQQRLMQQMLSNYEGESPPDEAGEIMAWISVHEDVDGPKLRKLAKGLGTDKATALGILVFLWFWGLRNADETGLILDADREDIESDLMSVTHLNICFVVDKLFEGGWLEERDGKIYIHDWDHWQEQWYKMLRAREYNTKKKREARAAIKQAEMGAGEPNDSEVGDPPDEEGGLPPGPPPPKVPEEPKYTVEFEQFWKIYPRKIDKGMAYKKYQARRKDGFSDEQLIAAATNYAAQCRKQKTEKQYIKHPKTFLSDTMPFLDFLPKQQSIMVSATVTNENPYAEWGERNG